MASPLEIAVQFLDDFGFFNVVLPFIFVFAIVFAILEKTLILGKEVRGENKDAPRSSINAMVSFAVALFVVGATNVVAVIKESLPMVVLVLVAIISFMLLAGSFMAGEFNFEDKPRWKAFLLILMFIAVILIFMGVIKTSSGVSWLSFVWNYTLTNWATGPIVSGLVFLIVIVASIFFIVWPFTSGDSGSSSPGSNV